MANAFGFIEITGIAAAVDALDRMCKSSDVRFVDWQRRLGGRLVTIIIEGNVSAVQEAVEIAKTGGIKEPVAAGVIARPHPEIVRLIKKEGGKENGTGSIGNDRDEGPDSGD